MEVQINKEGRTQYKRQYFFPLVSSGYVTGKVQYGSTGNSYRIGWSDSFIFAQFLYKTLTIGIHCPHCGLQMYGTWYRDEKFIASKTERYDFKPLYRGDHFDAGDGRLQAVEELWDLAEKEQAAYSEISRKIEAEISNVRAMQTCPICGGTLSEKWELELSDSGELFEKWELDSQSRKRNQNDYGHFMRKNREKLIFSGVNCPEVDDVDRNNLNSTSLQNTDIDTKKIVDDPTILQKYIKQLLNVEMTIQLLERRHENLLYWIERHHKEYILQLAERMSEISGAQYSKAYKKAPTIEDVVLREEMPIAPQFMEKPPIEPEYIKAGLFNKKKVEAQNERLRTTYEAARQAYLLKLEEYNQACNAYQSALEAYSRKKQEAYACLLNEHNRKVEAERTAFIAQIARNRSEISEQLGAYMLYQQAMDEIKRTDELLSQSYACRKSLYSCGVIYEKYRNPVALASFLDYVASGRCTTLTGADGAYNIYENEVRLDRIVTKLDVVIKKLDQIIENQHSLYSLMSEMNSSLKSLDRTSKEMADSIKAIEGCQKTIAESTSVIAENTAVIAHNTAVTALYAKKNAELTDALGFMVALK